MRTAKSGAVGWPSSTLAALLCVAPPLTAQPVADRYETKLGLTPTPDGIKPKITGTGSVGATLQGQTLKIGGQFSGLNGSAAAAHLMKGAGIGIPGTVLSDVGLVPDRGEIVGSVKLSREQIEALRAGRLYVQIDSDTSPAPMGHLWGWLLPAHAHAAEDEPQSGRWFLPQGEGLKSPSRASSGK